MFKYIAAAMIVVPALEIYGLIIVGRWIGGMETLLLILLTGGLGAFLARREAGKVWNEARGQLAAGIIPGRSVVDGICIFAGGLLLLTPGFLTDLTGFLLVFPITRPIFRHYILKWIRKHMERGHIQILR